MRLLLVFSFVYAVYGALFPTQKCTISDSECISTVAGQLLQDFVKGDKELGIPVLDVLRLDTINVNAVGLNLNFTDVKVSGLKDAVFEKFKINEKKKQLKVVFSTELTIKAHYKVAGRLVVIPISGDGQAKIQLIKANIHITANYADNEKNGQHFMELTDYKYSYQVTESLKVHLSNLFDGNKFLSDNIHNFINENWPSIEQEIGRPSLDPTIQVIYDALRTYLLSEPIEALFNT